MSAEKDKCAAFLYSMEEEAEDKMQLIGLEDNVGGCL